MLDQNKTIKADAGVILIYMYREMCERATHQELCFECICKNMCRTLFWYVLFMFYCMCVILCVMDIVFSTQ